MKNLPNTPHLVWDRFSWVNSPTFQPEIIESHDRVQCNYHKREVIESNSIALPRIRSLQIDSIEVEKTLIYEFRHMLGNSYFSYINMSYQFLMNATMDGSKISRIHGEIYLRGEGLPFECQNCWRSYLRVEGSQFIYFICYIFISLLSIMQIPSRFFW